MNCKESRVQEYQCQITYKGISFDKCLFKELLSLWNKGIKTTGCCCGMHCNCEKNMSYIGVGFNDIDKMKNLGYKVRFNPMRPTDQDSFIPQIKLQNKVGFKT